MSDPFSAFFAYSEYRFADRRDAGRRLAAALAPFGAESPVVLALPRGGVPVAVEIAAALDAPLDVLLVRKLGSPGWPELGLGAVVDGSPPQRFLNREVIASVRPPAGWIDAEEARQLAVIAERRQSLRRGRGPVALAGRTAIVVDDGIATGGTVAVALMALERAGAKRAVVAVPVAPRSAREALGLAPEDFVCLIEPPEFRAVGEWYADFDQVDDAEVVALLDRARARRGGGGAG